MKFLPSSHVLLMFSQKMDAQIHKVFSLMTAQRARKVSATRKRSSQSRLKVNVCKVRDSGRARHRGLTQITPKIETFSPAGHGH